MPDQSKQKRKYAVSNPEAHVFVDQATSGMSDDNNGSYKITESTMKWLLKNLYTHAMGERLGEVEFLGSRHDDKMMEFYLVANGQRIRYEVKNEGARGIYLNASWNPTKVITGQNVHRPKSGTYEIAGIEFELMPSHLVEFPFKLFQKAMKKIEWPGKVSLKDAIDKGKLFWRRLDLTTYTAEFQDENALQQVLHVLDVMASSKKVVGDEGEDQFLELSLRSFANVKFEAFHGKDEKYETLYFSKLETFKGTKVLYGLLMYDKEVEVGTKNDRANQAALQMGNVQNRMRVELRLTPTALGAVHAFTKIVGERQSWSQVSALREAFPNMETFDRKKRELLVAALRDLHIDYLLNPRNPHALLKKYEGSEIGQLLELWKNYFEKRLPGANRVQAAGELTLTQKQTKDAYRDLKDATGIDVTRISFAEADTFWNSLVTAHIPKKKYLKIREGQENMGSMSDVQALRFHAMHREARDEAKKKALRTRRMMVQHLTSDAMSQNLIVMDVNKK